MIEQLTTTLESTFWFIIVILAIVFVHEFGHYYAARLCKVRVDVFSLGFGPQLCSFMDKLGTRWRIAAFPLGGYVKMFGDVNPASAPDFEELKKLPAEQKEATFYFKPLWQKAFIVFAGPLANYIFAFIIIVGLFANYGKVVIPPVIGEVMPDLPAAMAGLKKGDEIIAYDGKAVKDFLQIKQLIMLNTGKEIELTLQRDGQQLIVKVTPIIEQKKDEITGSIMHNPLLGITPISKGSRIHLSFMESVKEAGSFIYEMSIGMLKALWQLVSWQRGIDDLGGPIKIAKYTNHGASQGMVAVLWVIALLSINLGLLNLMPIPLLDGGHLFFYLVEAVIRRPIPPVVQNIAFRTGFVIIATLMAVAISSDIKSLFVN